MKMPDSQAARIATALGGYKSGGGWMALCPAHNDSTPSLSLRDANDGRVLVFCHAGCDQKTVIAALAERHLWKTGASENRTGPKIGLRPRAPIELDANDRNRTVGALRVWAKASPSIGTPVEIYLRLRGITIAIPETLKFHCGLRHPTGKLLPAMVAIVVHGTNNRPVGIHRTFLDPLTHDKSSVKPNKMMLGPCRGAVVRLGPTTTPLLIGEGLETCLSAMQATRLSAWAALSTSGMAALDLPRDIPDVVIIADGDAPGDRAATTAARRWACAGRRVRIARPPTGKDFNDVLLGLE